MTEEQETPKYNVGDIIETKVSIFDDKLCNWVPTNRHYLITEILYGRFGRYRVLCLQTNESHVEIFQYYDTGFGTKVN